MAKKILKPKKVIKDTWENTDKEQISLALGSEEYKERVADLAEVSADRPDDKFHTDLEESNEVEAVDNRSKNQKSDERNDTSRRKYRNQMGKRKQFEIAKNAVTHAAAETPGDEDDRRVSRMMPKNLDKIVYNDGIAEDDYVDTVFDKYM